MGTKTTIFLPARCNQRAHAPPMFAIPDADVCRSLHVIAPREIPSDELQDAIVSAQAGLKQARDAVGTGPDPVRLVLAGLFDPIGIFGKSIRRWERAVADTIAARNPLSNNTKAELITAVEDGAYRGMRVEANRMLRTFDRSQARNTGLAVAGAFVLGALSVVVVLAATRIGPFAREMIPSEMACGDQADGSRVCWVYTRLPTVAPKK